MAKQHDVRPIIKLRSTADTGYVYVTRKNKINSRERLVASITAFVSTGSRPSGPIKSDRPSGNA